MLFLRSAFELLANINATFEALLKCEQTQSNQQSTGRRGFIKPLLHPTFSSHCAHWSQTFPVGQQSHFPRVYGVELGSTLQTPSSAPFQKSWASTKRHMPGGGEVSRSESNYKNNVKDKVGPKLREISIDRLF